jgi:hypothetical protein
LPLGVVDKNEVLDDALVGFPLLFVRTRIHFAVNVRQVLPSPDTIRVERLSSPRIYHTAIGDLFDTAILTDSVGYLQSTDYSIETCHQSAHSPGNARRWKASE